MPRTSVQPLWRVTGPAGACPGELKDSMAELQRTYHTECHAVEMATDTARQLQRTAPRGSAEDRRQCAARVLLVPLSLYHRRTPPDAGRVMFANAGCLPLCLPSTPFFPGF